MSPYALVQERLERGPLYPWRVLVACALLNRTGRAQVRPMFEGLLARWPTPRAMSTAGRDLERAVRPLGLWRRRAGLLRLLSRRWESGNAGLESLPGVGQYALDAHAIFVEGRDDVRPRDGFLSKYVNWRKRHGTEEDYPEGVPARPRGVGNLGGAPSVP